MHIHAQSDNAGNITDNWNKRFQQWGVSDSLRKTIMLEELALVRLTKIAKYWAIYAIGSRTQQLMTITKESRVRFQRYEKRRRERPSSSEEYLLEDVQELQDRVTLRRGDGKESDSDFPETSLGVTTLWRGTSKHQAEKYLATGEIVSLECGTHPTIDEDGGLLRISVRSDKSPSNMRDTLACSGVCGRESLHEPLYGHRVRRFNSSRPATAPSALLRYAAGDSFWCFPAQELQ